MAKGGNISAYTEKWFKDRGYTQNKDGSWQPPNYKNVHGFGGIPVRATEQDSFGNFTVTFSEDHLQSPDLIKKQKVNNSKDFEVKPVTEWFIPYQTPSKKNSRINFVNKQGKQMSIPSKRHKDYITATKKYWEVFGIEFNQTIRRLNLTWPLDIEMTFVRSTKQIVDFFGPGETVFDCMTDFKWWPDDNSRYGKPFFGDMQVNKSKPGVYIKIINIS